MATCHCSESAQCNHRALLETARGYPKLQDRKRRMVAPGGGVLGEVASILCLTGPMVGAGILLYLRSLVSMVFLGRLGQLPLAGGSLALGFANITGYSVLSGLAGGMDPVCGQAFGAGRTDLLRAALRRTVLLLLVASLPICLLWLAMHRVLVATGQDPEIASTAYAYILCSLPDLIVQSFLHPLCIYLRAQSVVCLLKETASNWSVEPSLGLRQGDTAHRSSDEPQPRKGQQVRRRSGCRWVRNRIDAGKVGAAEVLTNLLDLLSMGKEERSNSLCFFDPATLTY